MTEVQAMTVLVERADAIVSICPPAAAHDLATEVARAGFDGLYVDANAVSPDIARSIGDLFEHVVDGSVIGPPAHQAGTTRLYLAGERAPEVAGWYRDSLVDARVVGPDIGSASALKMAYASWTKIGSAMLMAIRALADAEGVDDALVAEWALSQPGLSKRSDLVADRVSPKAWRFSGEMEQIAASFDAAGLPTGFAQAAHEIYTRMSQFKGSTATTLADVVTALEQPKDD